MNQLVIILCFLCITQISALSLISYFIPSIIDFRKEVALSCVFDPEREQLEYVKWYINDTIFYEYSPKRTPNKIFHYVDGISVQMAKSNATTVVLSPLYFTTSGEFTCEAGTYYSLGLSLSKFLQVVAEPKGSPTIEGFPSTLLWDDEVSLNCTTPASYPPPEIQWVISGTPAAPEMVTYYRDPEEEAAMRIQTRKASMRFQVSKLPFDLQGKANITCLSVVPGLFVSGAVFELYKPTTVGGRDNRIRAQVLQG